MAWLEHAYSPHKPHQISFENRLTYELPHILMFKVLHCHFDMSFK